MSRVLACAWREYKATAGTKAFIFGTFGVPLLISAVLVVVASTGLFEKEERALEGEIVVADGTDSAFLTAGLKVFFSPERQEELQEEQKQELLKALDRLPEGMRNLPGVQQSISMAPVPAKMLAEVRSVELDDATIEAEKEKVKGEGGPLAIIVVDERTLNLRDSALENAIKELKESGEDVEEQVHELPGHYKLFHKPTMDAGHLDRIRAEVSRLVVDARLRRAGHEPEAVHGMTHWPRSISRSVTHEGESHSAGAEIAQELMPFAFLFLLWISVFTSGQYLLMSTIEEKSSRVIEVLLSAISPMQIMLGKILGQGGIGLTILLVYGGVGLFAVSSFNLMSFVPVDQLGWFVLYFLMAYGIVASMMAAIGSAVNDVREASALMTPVMMVLIVPMVLWLPISQNPMGVFARSLSFVPPLTPFVMVMRAGQPSVEIPLWEMIATGVVGLLGVWFMVWAAKKIFRVGILMYGQPPSIMGLIKWLRYA